jgi:hypothetical protein
MVAYYGNYMIVISKLISFFYSMTGSIGASIGNLVAEGNKVRWVAQVVAEKYGYKERMVRLIVKMMDEEVK